MFRPGINSGTRTNAVSQRKPQSMKNTAAVTQSIGSQANGNMTSSQSANAPTKRDTTNRNGDEEPWRDSVELPADALPARSLLGRSLTTSRGTSLGVGFFSSPSDDGFITRFLEGSPPTRLQYTILHRNESRPPPSQAGEGQTRPASQTASRMGACKSTRRSRSRGYPKRLTAIQSYPSETCRILSRRHDLR